MAETELYGPVKAFLAARGYEVKGEIGSCDVFAARGDDEPPVVVELKKSLSLTLVLQAVDRLRVTDSVYVAIQTRRGRRGFGRGRWRRVRGLLRRLGLGLLTVSEDGVVTPLLDPGPYAPRKDRTRGARLVEEFRKRTGDPVAGGSAARPRLTAYRQDAVRCAAALGAAGELKVSELRDRTGVARAGPILRDNHYGWFARVRRGWYELTPRGLRELPEWLEALDGPADG